jgi:hypothetical protein
MEVRLSLKSLPFGFASGQALPGRESTKIISPWKGEIRERFFQNNDIISAI